MEYKPTTMYGQEGEDMSRLFMLVCDDRYVTRGNCAYFEYVYVGTEQEVRDEMEEIYSDQVLDEWSGCTVSDDKLELWDDEECCGLTFMMVDCGEMPTSYPMSLVMKFTAVDDEMRYVGSCGFMTHEDAGRYILQRHEMEISDPIDEWDDDYSDVDGTSSYLTSEYGETVIAYDVIDVVDSDGNMKHKIYRGIRYA